MAAKQYEYPFRVRPGRLPVFPTQHEAFDFLADYQARGAIYRCVHARVRPNGLQGWNEGYVVNCEQNSYEVVSVRALGPGDISRGFNGCPRSCQLYRPHWRAALGRWGDRFHPLFWFDRQPWQVKVALILLPALLTAIYFRVDLAAIVRAWRGQ